MTRAQALIAASKLAREDVGETIIATLRRGGSEVSIEVPYGTSLDGIVALREETLEAGYVAEFSAGYLEVKRAAEPKR